MLAQTPDAGQLVCSPSETTDEPKTFGMYVRRIRLRGGLTSQEMADRLEVCMPHYVRVELGRKAPPLPEKWGPFVAIGADAEVLRTLYDRFYEGGGRRKHKLSDSAKRDIAAGHPSSSSWTDLTWEEDDWCWYAVENHPEGLSQDQISALTGWAPSTVEAIELSALRKLKRKPEAREAFESLLLLLQCKERASHFEISPRW